MEYKLHDAEYRFALIIWKNEPIKSGDLAKICEKYLGWKRTTTYTVLKKLCERGIFKNNSSIVTSIVKKEEIEHIESNKFINKLFDNSLPKFITAFMGDKRLSNKDAEEIKNLIDSYKEGE